MVFLTPELFVFIHFNFFKLSQCNYGYTGPNCLTPINPCLSNPCGANGVCNYSKSNLNKIKF